MERGRERRGGSGGGPVRVPPPERLRLVVLGGGGVGKSALSIRFVQSYFPPAPPPTIEDTYTTLCAVDGTPAHLHILDTAGEEEEFGGSGEQHLRGGDGFLLVFAINDRESFGVLPRLRGRILRVKDRDDVPTVLVGNKADLPHRQVLREEAQTFARQNLLPYLEASAKTHLNVDEAFHELVRAIRRFRQQETPPALPVPPPRRKSPPRCPCALI